jgi:outer membrane protein assembly factor BamB
MQLCARQPWWSLATRSALLLALLLAGTGLGAATASSEPSQQAQQILQQSGVRGGLVLHLGCGNGQLTAALGANGSYVVQGLDADAKTVELARKNIQALGLYGKVSAERLAGSDLPYVANLVNLVVVEKLGQVPMSEVLRVLAPGGVACVNNGGQWTNTVKPWPKEIDQWTHYLHDPSNNAVAHDTVVGPPHGLQWFAGPLYCRTHETDSSISAMVSANGRLFYVLDEGPIGVADERLSQKWALVARDAFSGVPLWEVPLPEWGWPQWKQRELTGVDWSQLSGQRLRSPVTLPRRLVTDGDRVYVTLGYNAPVTILDAVTGATLRTCAGTENADEILCSGKTLVVCVRSEHVRSEAPKGSKTADSKKRNKKGSKQAAEVAAAETPAPTTDRIVALNAETGRKLWEVPAGSVVQLSLAVEGGRVFYQDGTEVICLDLNDGASRWRSTSRAKGGARFSSGDTLVVCQGVVLVNAQDLEAFAADTGKLLWSNSAAKGPGISNAPDLFLTGGLVWHGGDVHGRDPQTGEIKQTLDLQKLINPWHHYRCYRSKATDRYLIWPKQGAEFIDLTGDNNMRHDWFRGPCKYGILPCNGLIYSGPHQCSCFAGVKLNGFNALTAHSAFGAEKPQTDARLEKGPAYETPAASPASLAPATDWPSFRADHRRSGSSSTVVPASLASLWQVKLTGKLSQCVVANGRLWVAAIDRHQICCLSAKDGHALWSFTAGARVDSPPTIFGDLVLFGSADGWIYCVQASDGALRWRFRAAPAERHLVSLGQIESVWPAHGSVLVQNGIAYVTAGRSSYLDGGLFLCALDPATGKLLHQARLEGPEPDVSKDDNGSRDMPGARSDVLVGDGQAVYLRQVKFDAALQQQGSWDGKDYGSAAEGMRLMSTSDLLDDSEFNRTCWRYAPQWSSKQGGDTSGQILVFNSTTSFAAQVYSKHQAQSELYFPGQEYVKLFAVRHGSQPSEEVAGKGKKRAAASESTWNETVPIYARAMALADKTLFVAGLPDTLDPKDSLAVLEGRRGGVLWAVSATDGKKLGEVQLDVPPIFDGVIAAEGRLFVSLADGRVLCMGGKESAGK